MRPTPTRSLPVAPASRLKILVAGLDKDARGPVEARVRRVLALRSTSETWTVSLVKLGSRWSVTLNGPSERTRNLSLTTDEPELEQAIRRALEADAPVPDSAAPEPHAAAAAHERHVCTHCGGALVVSYESHPGEEKQLAPVACPYCWQLDHVEVGAWAAAGADYRCEKALPADRPQAS